MPKTSFSVSSNDFSGQIRPSKPSGMPITFQPYLRIAALVAARITALRPGASPPPVAMPIERISDMSVVGRQILLVFPSPSIVISNSGESGFLPTRAETKSLAALGRNKCGLIQHDHTVSIGLGSNVTVGRRHSAPIMLLR